MRAYPFLVILAARVLVRLGLSSRRGCLGHLHEPAQRVDQPHLLDRPRARFQQPGARHDERQAHRARDGDVQAIAREENSSERGMSSALEVAIE